MPDQFDLDETTRSAELLRVLIDSIDAAQADQRALRYAVCAYIRGQKGRGVSCEEATETVRSILANPGTGLNTPTFGAFERIEAHAKSLVDWCVKYDHRGIVATS
jgi:hypothetical protein